MPTGCAGMPDNTLRMANEGERTALSCNSAILLYLQNSSHFPFIVFQHYYRGPVLTSTNSTVVFQQLGEILNQTKIQAGNGSGEHAKAASLMDHTEGHALIFLPESLVQCTREMPILCLLLMLGTLWLGYTLYLIKRR